MVPDRTIEWLFYLSLFCLAGTALFFTIFDRLDLVISGWFYRPGAGFLLAEIPALILLREAVWKICLTLPLIALAAWLWASIRPDEAILSRRVSGFVIAAFLLGPGLVVNVVMKGHWGRARPRNVEDFGGDLSYTTAMLPSDQCLRNCSFVSGEAAGVTTLAVVIALLLAPCAKPLTRFSLLLALTLLTFLVSCLRVGFGGHFISDVMLAIFLMPVLILPLYLAFFSKSDAGSPTPCQMIADLGRRALTVMTRSNRRV